LAWRQLRKQVYRGAHVFKWQGLSFEVFPDSTSAGRIYYLDLPDWWEMNFLQRFLRPGDVVADVGANIGGYALLAASLVGPKGTVVAFEPDPYNIDRFRRQLQRNDLSQLRIVEAAVGANDTTLFLKAGKDSLSNIVVLAHEGIPVRGVSLDTYFSRLQPPIFVKVDVEGYEEPVVRGALSLIYSGFPLVWQLELGGLGSHYGYSECSISEILLANGYEFYRYDPEKGMLVLAGNSRTDDEDNVLAVRDPDRVNARLRSAAEE
jgi:FkbM family methyltransferase